MAAGGALTALDLLHQRRQHALSMQIALDRARSETEKEGLRTRHVFASMVSHGAAVGGSPARALARDTILSVGASSALSCTSSPLPDTRGLLFLTLSRRVAHAGIDHHRCP